MTNLPVHVVDLVLDILLHLLGLLELLLDDQAMVRLHDLLVDELVPRLGVQLVVEVEVVAFVALVVLHVHHLVPVADRVVDRGTQLLSLGLLCDFLPPIVEAHLVGLRGKANRLLPPHLDIAIVLVHHILLFTTHGARIIKRPVLLFGVKLVQFIGSSSTRDLRLFRWIGLLSFFLLLWIVLLFGAIFVGRLCENALLLQL